MLDRRGAQTAGEFLEIGPASLRSSVQRERRARPGAEPKARVDHRTLRSRRDAVKRAPRSENGASERKQEEALPQSMGSARSVCMTLAGRLQARAEDARAGPAVRSTRLLGVGSVRPRLSQDPARAPENLEGLSWSRR